MTPKRLVVLFFSFVFTVNAEGQKEAVEIKIGAPCPNFEIRNLINYKDTTLSPLGLRGKWFILDFWATFCIPCVSSIPKLEELQKQFSSDLQIVLVGTNDDLKIRTFYDRKRQQGEDLKLPCAIDSSLWRIFNVQTVPHDIWVDDRGIVRAITDYQYVTESNIRSFIKGELISLPIKADTKIDFDINKRFLMNGNGGDGSNLLFRSVLTGYTPGITGMYSFPNKGKGTKVNAFNSSIMQLYMIAYGDSVGRYPYNRVKLEMDKPSFYEYNGIENYDTWKLQHKYCYELNVTEDRADQILFMMQQDLKRYFGLKVSKELHNSTCWILINQNNAKLHTSGGKAGEEWDVNGVRLTNKPLSSLLGMIEYYHQKKIFFDSTNYKGNVDIKLECNMLDLNKLNQALANYNLKLIEVQRNVEILILNDR